MFYPISHTAFEVNSISVPLEGVHIVDVILNDYTQRMLILHVIFLESLYDKYSSVG